MAVVTITITDDGVGGANVQASSIPPIPEDDAECTPAMLTGAIVMKVIDAMVKQAIQEGNGE